jgi:hypothetical protein
MVAKTRLALRGGCVSGTCSSRAHFAAFKASSDFELTAVRGLQARVNPALSYMRKLVSAKSG